MRALMKAASLRGTPLDSNSVERQARTCSLLSLPRAAVYGTMLVVVLLGADRADRGFERSGDSLGASR